MPLILSYHKDLAKLTHRAKKRVKEEGKPINLMNKAPRPSTSSSFCVASNDMQFIKP